MRGNQEWCAGTSDYEVALSKPFPNFPQQGGSWAKNTLETSNGTYNTHVRVKFVHL